ncbi:hypothetical protein PM3016_6270 [Paenibacillus mucilaginosus 3016]|uniref:Uncharacterized protein n=3 Tax=Paenibacillus mucilaginosus TaxID=61624 RepID=H6NBF8_9BACL|nr:hypothetical protein [Paenibacillus mucilaginosus]AFC32904.1 hypothetical protein PM3016_6270 [Paenibacillus mucilaginosus 3016]AFH65214.1 hypothetical protein B2K_31670 [Paenibacillus mucilaginosus K02]WFA21353.1 hypothetical protein ERY13_31150 [Paenibacillus mucilaginosus]
MNKLLLPLTVLLGAALFLAGVMADRPGSPEAGVFPMAEDITAARMIPGGEEEGAQSPVDLNLQHDDKNRLEIARILYWLSVGTLQGGLSRQPLPSGGPEQLVMETADGTVLTLTNAVDRIAVPAQDSWLTTGVSVPQTVNVRINDMAGRITAPDLKRWMEEDLPRRIEESRKAPQ